MLVNSLMTKLFLNTDLQKQPGGPNICLTLYQRYSYDHVIVPVYAFAAAVLNVKLDKTAQACMFISSLQSDIFFVWGFTAQSTLLTSCPAGQLTYSHRFWAGLDLLIKHLTST